MLQRCEWKKQFLLLILLFTSKVRRKELTLRYKRKKGEVCFKHGPLRWRTKLTHYVSCEGSLQGGHFSP